MWPNSQEMGNIYTWLHLLKVSIMENNGKPLIFLKILLNSYSIERM